MNWKCQSCGMDHPCIIPNIDPPDPAEQEKLRAKWEAACEALTKAEKAHLKGTDERLNEGLKKARTRELNASLAYFSTFAYLNKTPQIPSSVEVGSGSILTIKCAEDLGCAPNPSKAKPLFRSKRSWWQRAIFYVQLWWFRLFLKKKASRTDPIKQNLEKEIGQ
jgi:hypothetical protein